jgi:hypothetical protein
VRTASAGRPYHASCDRQASPMRIIPSTCACNAAKAMAERTSTGSRDRCAVFARSGAFVRRPETGFLHLQITNGSAQGSRRRATVACNRSVSPSRLGWRNACATAAKDACQNLAESQGEWVTDRAAYGALSTLLKRSACAGPSPLCHLPPAETRLGRPASTP